MGFKFYYILKSIFFLGFLIVSFNCQLTRHSDDVLKRERIFIEAHRCVTEGQKNHNSKEAILNAMDNKVEAIETDAWMTLDKKVVLNHDDHFQGYLEGYNINNGGLFQITIPNNNWSFLKDCKNIYGKKIPLLEDIIQITKGKIFMNLEIKDNNEEIWEKIQELIEKYEYYDQISISSFNHNYYEKVEKYNNDYNRKIVFSFLYHQFTFNQEKIFNGINRPNHQISINALFLQNNRKLIEDAHNNGMTVSLWFFSDLIPEPIYYYNIFELGIDVIITDYPIRVANQLKEFYSDKRYFEGCKSIEKNIKNITSCISCKNGYELIYLKEENRNRCKLKYEIIPDLYIKDEYNVFQKKNIFAIKMLYSPIQNEAICQKNEKTIFYFEWLFDLYGYDYAFSYDNNNYQLTRYIRKYILNVEKREYSLLTEEHIKKLNFNNIEIYVDNNLINSNNFLCIDLFDTTYYSIYTVMGAHCYFIYNGEQKDTYEVKFRLFDDNYQSFVTYDNVYLNDVNSWKKSEIINFYTKSSYICDKIKDPFQERISCINKINNCKYCENENTCQECIKGFSLFNGNCFPLTDYKNNSKYFTPDLAKNYYSCSSVIDNCEECFYDYFSFNNLHCTKCSNGFNLSDSYECVKSQDIIPFTNSLSGIFIGSSCLNENNQSKCETHKIDIPNFSCWKYYDTLNNEEHCVIYPDTDLIQIEYYNFYLGISKEDLLINYKHFPLLYNKSKIMIPEKVIYKNEETIKFKSIKDIIKEEDLLIFNESNTCYSHFFKGYSSFWSNGTFPNISNPDICYNAIKFSQHENILDCGFAEISFQYE